MKKLEELGISPAPWRIGDENIDGMVDDVFDSGFGDESNSALVVYDGGMSAADARLIAAAPKLYKWLAFAVERYKCETRSCNNCPNGKCWVVDAKAALAEAAGESEAHDGK